jgi:isopentenyl-diphosphate delta-isomerase type 1
MSNQVAQPSAGARRTPSRHPLSADSAGPEAGVESVVLLDARGRPSGTAAKAQVHHDCTPFHLGFSCHVIAASGGRVLLARRAATKRTWPAIWSNACCGHPGPGETLRRAVERRLRDELGLVPRRVAVAVPDFTYRAVMDDGTVEHELCPVVVAEVDREPRPDPAEVDAVAWVTWDDLRARVDDDPRSLSPWAVEQVRRLAELAPSPLAWLDARIAWGTADAPWSAVDRPAAIHVVADAPAAGSNQDPIATVRAPVEQVIDEFLSDRLAEVRHLDASALAVAAEVQRLVALGGKRLRPAFAYWAYRATGAQHDDGVVVATAALELLHTFALLHDDVMDRSARRRGRPSAHRNLAAVHRRDGLDGDDGWFGVSGAVLAGDLAFLWATQLLGEAPLPPDALARARRVFAHLCTEVIAGQYLDLRLAAGDGDRQPDGGDALARQVALLKSARYTVTRPLELGAALAGPPAGTPALQPALAAYGDAVGLAFQLRDDVLGLFGDPDVTGKSQLDDLREGKRTLLVVRALHLAPDADAQLLATALGDPQLDEATAARCREIVAASGALASVETLIAIQQDEAITAARGVDQPARAALEALAARAAQRDR